MSNTTKSSPIKNDDVPSPPKEILFSKITEVVPLTTVLPESSKKKSSSKKEKSQVSETTYPSATVKGSKRKSKKSKPKSVAKNSHTMHELYVENLDKPNVDPIVDTSINNTVISTVEIVKDSETLGLENPKSTENLGKDDLGCSDGNKVDDGASTKAMSDSVLESLKESIPGTDAVPDAMASVGQENLENAVIPESLENVTIPEKSTETTMTNNVSDNNIAVISQSDESLKTVSEHLEDDESAGKDKDADLNVINVDNLNSGGSPAEKTSAPSIAKRLRSNSGKDVATASEPIKTTKETRNTGKKPMYGPPKAWSKGVPPSEKKKKHLKRKEISTSDSDFDVESDVIATTITFFRKSVGGKKVPQNVPSVPMDNISFHHEESAPRWKFVCKRRLAIERNLSEDLLKCQELVGSINEAGLMKTVTRLGKCYEKLAREFLVNIGEDCDDPESLEFRKIFVRGKCVNFSPTVINQHLGRDTDEVPELEVTQNEVCKTLTGNLIKEWPRKNNLSATKLTAKYGLLNKIAAANWVPTTHSNVVATGLARFVYDVADVPSRRESDLSLDYRLFEGTHAVDIVAPSDKKSGSVMTKKQMITDLKESSKALEARKLEIDHVIQALEAVVEKEGGVDDVTGDESEGGGDTEELQDDSETSPSI
ncbi:envelope-like protein [Trifolium medium]|uniref:Envelope-like protein n=1 Tax=Trifolium medium TaxID=97028 RepID=A0A392M1P1_9FABA|nr:envelope-like protein [Trifolium medium]